MIKKVRVLKQTPFAKVDTICDVDSKGNIISPFNLVNELVKCMISDGWFKWIKEEKVYESDCHGIEMIKSPSGKECAIGGTNHPDRWNFSPWSGEKLIKEESPCETGHKDWLKEYGRLEEKFQDFLPNTLEWPRAKELAKIARDHYLGVFDKSCEHFGYPDPDTPEENKMYKRICKALEEA